MEEQNEQVKEEFVFDSLSGEVVEDVSIKTVKKGRVLDTLIKVFGVLGSLTTVVLFINLMFL